MEYRYRKRLKELKEKRSFYLLRSYVKDINDLLQLNLFNCGIQRVKEYTLCHTRPDLVLKSGQLIKSTSIFSPLEQTHLDKWQHENFSYEFSELGFRDIELPEHISLGAFGCSYTFGLGIPEDKTWHRCLSDNSYNFGQPGASIQSIADIFCIISNFVKIDKAIFLFPNYMRDLIATGSDKDYKLLSLLPNRNNDSFEYLKEYYKYIPHNDLIRKMKDAVYLIEYICKLKNIKVYMSSWDRPTYELLKLMDFTYARLINEWTLPNQSSMPDFARDCLHPGISQHKYWSDNIKDQVF